MSNMWSQELLRLGRQWTRGSELRNGSRNADAPQENSGKSSEPESGLGLWPSFILAILVAGLSFGGSTLGSYLSDLRTQAQWEREFTAEWRQQILQERIDILERTVLAINQRDSANQMMNVINAMAAELTAAILADYPDKEVTVPAADLLPVLEQRLQVNEMTREFSTALSLCALFFGPRTRAAIAMFEDSHESWWGQEELMFKQLGDALWAELSYDL